jgi:MFS family permease
MAPSVETAVPEGWVRLIRLSILTSPASALGTIMPTLVTSFVARGIPLSIAGVLGAAEMIGMTLIQFCAPLFIARYNRRALASIAVGLAVGGQLFSLFTEHAAILGGLRVVAGIGEGCLFSLAIASLAGTSDPDRAFGVALASGQIFCTVMLVVMASVSIRHPAQGAIGVFGIFLMITTLCISTLPGRDAVPLRVPANGATRGSFHNVPTICGLAGMFLLSCALGSVWPIVGQIAAARGVQPSVIATGFSVAGFGGMSGALVAAVLAIRFGRRLPLVLASTGYAVCLILTNYPVSFPVLTFLLLFFALACIPYYMGVLAWLDTSGRLSVITGAMIPLGIAVSEALAGTVVAAAGFRGATFEGCGLVLVALALMLVATRLKPPPADLSKA